ncbi:hypothetical protein LINGRAHAP2_LOCUS9521 [Linum grandiflorum]
MADQGSPTTATIAGTYVETEPSNSDEGSIVNVKEFACAMIVVKHHQGFSIFWLMSWARPLYRTSTLIGCCLAYDSQQKCSCCYCSPCHPSLLIL